MTEVVRKGRHRLLSDEVILRAALESFAAEGFESMSVRQLNTSLGLSHETVRQRFGSKRELYFAAVDFGTGAFFELLGEERALLPDAVDELEELRLTTRAFMTASIRFPQMANLVNHEATSPSERLDYVFANAFEAGMILFNELLQRLAAADVIYPVTIRDAFFIIDAGMSPYLQGGLSRSFDATCGPLDPVTHVDEFLDFVFRGLVKRPIG
jgi:AcrR family transcriptional regulator